VTDPLTDAGHTAPTDRYGSEPLLLAPAFR
jgi:hypothetical protein